MFTYIKLIYHLIKIPHKVIKKCLISHLLNFSFILPVILSVKISMQLKLATTPILTVAFVFVKLMKPLGAF